MDEKKVSRILSSAITMPCIFEISIFLCFRFADWREQVGADVQFRIFWGSLTIAICFLTYYLTLFFGTKKYYQGSDRTKILCEIFLSIILGLGACLIGYFLKSPM